MRFLGIWIILAIICLLILGVSLANDLKKYQQLCYETIDFKGISIIKQQFGLSLAFNGDEVGALKLYQAIKEAVGIKSANYFLKSIYKNVQVEYILTTSQMLVNTLLTIKLQQIVITILKLNHSS